MFPLTFAELAQLTEAELKNSSLAQSLLIENISIDTRDLSAGDLFFALQGENYDGHFFLNDAFQKNAIGAVVSSDFFSGHFASLKKNELIARYDKPILVVKETLQALQTVAKWNGKQSDALKIGITGSVGKTTTRHLIHTVLSESYSGIQSPRNYNNQIGVPISLLQFEKKDEFGVIEFGASAPKEIAELAQWAEPEVAILTTIGPAHLEGFGSVEKIIRSKAELLDAVAKNGLIILPEETAALPLVKKCLQSHKKSGNVFTVGQTNGCDIYAENVVFQLNCLHFSVQGKEFQLQVPAKHFLNAALIAFGLARELGLSHQQIQAGFNRFEPLPGRCQLRQIGTWTVLDDCYNANPLSVTAGLNAIAELTNVTEKIVILGDMLGLGNHSAEYHQKVGTQVANANVDTLFTCGNYSSDIARGAMRAGMNASKIGAFNNFNAMLEILPLWITEQAGLLIKGSRETQMERVITWLEEQTTPAALIEQKANYRLAS